MKLLCTLLLAVLFCGSCETTPDAPRIEPGDSGLQSFVGARVRLKDDWWAVPVSDPAELGAPHLLYVGNVGGRAAHHLKPGTLVTVVEFRNVSDSTSGSMPHVILEIPARPPAVPVRVAMMLDPGGFADDAGIERQVQFRQTPTQNLAQALAPRNNVIWKRVD
jgi:hypothetical protein